jgi:hypothetical protein
MEMMSALAYPALTLCSNNRARRDFLRAYTGPGTTLPEFCRTHPDTKDDVNGMSDAEILTYLDNLSPPTYEKVVGDYVTTMAQSDGADTFFKSAVAPLSSLLAGATAYQTDADGYDRTVVPVKACHTQQRFWLRDPLTTHPSCHTFRLCLADDTPLERKNGQPQTVTLQFSVDTAQYWTSQESPGIHVSLHAEDEPPARFTALVTGRAYSWRLQPTRTQMQPAPYGNCRQDKELAHFDKYSYAGCLEACSSSTMESVCGCRFYDNQGSAAICQSSTQLSCSRGSDKQAALIDCSATCTPACEASGYVVMEDRDQAGTAGRVDVTLAYADLSVTSSSQKAEYQMTDLLKDIGQLLGWWVVTGFIVTLVLMEIVRCCQQRKAGKGKGCSDKC